MSKRLRHWISFHLERTLLRRTHIRLLVVALMIAFISLVAGCLVYYFSPVHNDLASSTWWAFLRLTDPGYLGDDDELAARLISTGVTILGYLIFLGALIAIMTQWLEATITRFERGESPIFFKNHVLILGHTGRTTSIVRQLLLYEGRVKRFLKSSGASRLRIVILVEDLNPKLVSDMKTRIGDVWNEKLITFRSGIARRPGHLERVNFSQASVIIIPADDYGSEHSIDKDTSTIKALLTMANHPKLAANAKLPRVVVELRDDQKLNIARQAYRGQIDLLTSNAWISRLVVQNVRQPTISYLARELMTHNEGDELYVRSFPELAGRTYQSIIRQFVSGVLLGVVRKQDNDLVPFLNPDADFIVEQTDVFVVLAQSFDRAAPAESSILVNQKPKELASSVIPEPQLQKECLILILGWSRKTAALLKEFSVYEREKFSIHICSMVAIEERKAVLEQFEVEENNLSITHSVADYSCEKELLDLDITKFDNLVILGSSLMDSGDESDARSLLGYLIVHKILEDRGKPEVLIELMDASNRALFRKSNGEVFASPLVVSHLLAQVALRPELGAVYDVLFGAGDMELYFRPLTDYGVSDQCTFEQVQVLALEAGETAIGFKFAVDADNQKSPLTLNPPRGRVFNVSKEDRVIVITKYRVGYADQKAA